MCWESGSGGRGSHHWTCPALTAVDLEGVEPSSAISVSTQTYDHSARRGAFSICLSSSPARLSGHCQRSSLARGGYFLLPRVVPRRLRASRSVGVVLILLDQAATRLREPREMKSTLETLPFTLVGSFKTLPKSGRSKKHFRHVETRQALGCASTPRTSTRLVECQWNLDQHLPANAVGGACVTLVSIQVCPRAADLQSAERADAHVTLGAGCRIEEPASSLPF